jgi:hypothetical protein
MIFIGKKLALLRRIRGTETFGPKYGNNYKPSEISITSSFEEMGFTGFSYSRRTVPGSAAVGQIANNA